MLDEAGYWMVLSLALWTVVCWENLGFGCGLVILEV